MHEDTLSSIWKIIFVCTISFGSIICSADTAADQKYRQEDCGPRENFYPPSAYVLPVEQRLVLQRALDTHRIIKLDAGDYRIEGGGNLTLKSGQQLYGVPGKTILPHLTVEPGAQYAVVKGVRIDNMMSFPPSTLVTRFNCFSTISTGVQIRGARLENNLFLNFYRSQFDIDTVESGWLTNNKFIRLQAHASGGAKGPFFKRPAISIRGDIGLQSSGNIFLWINALTPIGSAISVENQKDIVFAGVDVEDARTPDDGRPMIWVRNTRRLNAIALQGAFPAGMLDIGADDFVLYGGQKFYNAGSHPFTLTKDNQRAAWFAGSTDLAPLLRDESSTGSRIFADWDKFRTSIRIAQGKSSDLAGKSLYDLLGDQFGQRSTGAWRNQAQGFSAGALNTDLQADISSGMNSKDDADSIQALIDASKGRTVKLESRSYYIGRTLKLHAGQALIGAGKGRTKLIAKTRGLSMIELDLPQSTDSGSRDISIIDLSLIGGRIGLHSNQPNTQLSFFYIGNVEFRDMSEAGIYIENIFGWDNGFLDGVDFIRNEVGFKQRGTGRARDTYSYMDKVVFFRNRFTDCGIAVELSSTRQNNLNAWIETTFSGSKSKAISFNYANVNSIFANSEFIGNNGDPVVEVGHSASIISTRFIANPGKTLLSPGTSCEGCIFSSSGMQAKIFSTRTSNGSRYSAMFNSESIDVPLGLDESSSERAMPFISINNIFSIEDRGRVPAFGALIQAGKDNKYMWQRLWDGWPAKPGSRLLY